MDFGYTLNIDKKQLFQFPLEFASLPFQVVHLTITGLEQILFEEKVVAERVMEEINYQLQNSDTFACVHS